MRPIYSVILALVLSTTLTGCFSTTYVLNKKDLVGDVISLQRRSVLQGAIQDSPAEIGGRCSKSIKSIEISNNFMDMILYWATLGIVDTKSIVLNCAA